MQRSGDDNENRSGLIYRHVQLYRLAMWLLYGHTRRRERDLVLAAIPAGSSVVDLCCGDCHIAQGLLARNCTYLGLDVNVVFLESARRRGINARYWAGEPDEIPEADVIVMLSSLYQFIPNERRMAAAMARQARIRAIIVEPVRNWATSSFPLLRRVAESLTRVNGRSFSQRLSEVDMLELARFAERDGVSATSIRLARAVMVTFETADAASRRTVTG